MKMNELVEKLEAELGGPAARQTMSILFDYDNRTDLMTLLFNKNVTAYLPNDCARVSYPQETHSRLGPLGAPLIEVVSRDGLTDKMKYSLEHGVRIANNVSWENRTHPTTQLFPLWYFKITMKADNG